MMLPLFFFPPISQTTLTLSHLFLDFCPDIFPPLSLSHFSSNFGLRVFSLSLLPCPLTPYFVFMSVPMAAQWAWRHLPHPLPPYPVLFAPLLSIPILIPPPPLSEKLFDSLFYRPPGLPSVSLLLLATFRTTQRLLHLVLLPTDAPGPFFDSPFGFIVNGAPIPGPFTPSRTCLGPIFFFPLFFPTP